LISEQVKNDTSIYKVKAEFSIFGKKYGAYLTQACRPQHVLFIAGIIVSCWGVTGIAWLAGAVGVAALSYGLFSRPRDLGLTGSDDSNGHGNGGSPTFDHRVFPSPGSAGVWSSCPDM
jgi:hypothetical protein